MALDLARNHALVAAGTLPEDEIDDAIEMLRGALEALVEGDKDHDDLLATLAATLLLRFYQRLADDDFRDAMDLYGRLPGPDEGSRAMGLIHARLAIVIRVVARSARDTTAAEKAVRMLESALGDSTPDDSWHGQWQAELGHCRLLLHQLSPDPEMLNRAVDAFAAAVAHTPASSSELRAAREWDWGLAAIARWLSGHDPGDLAAINAQLAPEVADSLLGQSLAKGVERASGGDTSELDALIELGEHLAAREPPNPDWHASRLSNLTVAIHQRFLQEEDQRDLDAAVAYARDALTTPAPSAEHTDPARLILGSVLCDDGAPRTASRLEDLHDGYALLAEVSARLPPGDADQRFAVNRLVRAGMRLYEESKDISFVEETAARLGETVAAIGDREPRRGVDVSLWRQMLDEVLLLALVADDVTEPLLDQAVAAYRELIETEPDHPTIAKRVTSYATAVRLRVLRWLEGRVAAAASREHPPTEEAVAAFNEGVLRTQAGEVREAIAAYERAIELGDGDAASNLGLLFESYGRWERARDAFARGRDIGHARSALLLGMRLEADGGLADAEESYRAALELGDALAGVTLGNLLWRAGRETEAASAYEGGIALGAGDAAVLLGDLHRAGGRPVCAWASYTVAATLGGEVGGERLAAVVALGLSPDPIIRANVERANGGHGTAAFDLGLGFLALEDDASALVAFDIATQLGIAEAAFTGGNIHLQAGRTGEAQAAFELGAELGSRNAAFNLADVHHRAGRDDDAMRALERAMELGDGQAAMNVAVLHQSAARLDDAMAALSRAIELGEASAGTRLGALLAGSGRIDAACQFWRTAAEAGEVEAAALLVTTLHQLGEELELADVCEQTFRRGAALEQNGDVDGASVWYAVAARGRHGRASVAAARLLAGREDVPVDQVLLTLTWGVVLGLPEAAALFEEVLARASEEKRTEWRDAIAQARTSFYDRHVVPEPGSPALTF